MRSRVVAAATTRGLGRERYSTATATPVTASGVSAVVAYCIERNDGRWPEIAAQVIATIEREPRVALWGCGYGFLQMLGADARLEALIRSREVVVFDNQHFGKAFLGGTVRDESSLREFTGTVILTPALAASRQAMRIHASRLGAPPERFVDPYG